MRKFLYSALMCGRPNEIEYIAFCSADRSARATTTAIMIFEGEVISLDRFATNLVSPSVPSRPATVVMLISIRPGIRIFHGGDVACNVVYGVIATLLTLFYTDYAGVSVATVGLVMLISRFFDGGSDVVMGFIVDRTHSKWGQSRPWILWMSLPYALSAILLFSVPHTNATIQFLYIFVTYNFCTTVCYTAINLPYGSLSAMMTRDSKERDLLSVFRMGMSPMGRIIAVTCTMPLIKLFGDDQAAWIKVMSIWAAIAFLLLITCFVKCEETVHIAACINRINFATDTDFSCHLAGVIAPLCRIRSPKPL